MHRAQAIPLLRVLILVSKSPRPQIDRQTKCKYTTNTVSAMTKTVAQITLSFDKGFSS